MHQELMRTAPNTEEFEPSFGVPFEHALNLTEVHLHTLNDPFDRVIGLT